MIMSSIPDLQKQQQTTFLKKWMVTDIVKNETKTNRPIDSAHEGKHSMVNHASMNQSATTSGQLENMPAPFKPKRKKALILVGICSSQAYVEKRNAVRETWLTHPQEGIECLFFLGGNVPEHERNDTIGLDVPDTYNRLPSKVLAFFRYALENYEFDWLFKCDEDTYLDLSRLPELADTRYGMVGDMTLARHNFPSGGAGYLLSRPIVEKIASRKNIPSCGAEDVLLSGIALEEGAVPHATHRLFPFNTKYLSSENDMISVHWCSPELMRMMEVFRHQKPASIYGGKHPKWEDDILFYKEGIFRRSSTSCYGWWSLSEDNMLTLHWKTWPEERLMPDGKRFHRQTFYMEKDETHPSLQDLATGKNKQRIKRGLNRHESVSTLTPSTFPPCCAQAGMEPSSMIMSSISNVPERPHISFADFRPGFDPQQNMFLSLLQSRLDAVFEEDPARADLLIYSAFGDKHRSFEGTRVFYAGEPVMPQWEECDYALTFLRDGGGKPERHFRLPSWTHEKHVRNAAHLEQFPADLSGILSRRTKFCNFIYSNGNAQESLHFLNLLAHYRHVDSAGKFRNNTGIQVQDKIGFRSRYKFTIAFEQQSARGYVTEVLTDAFASGSLPIYWGDPDVGLDFNPARFVNARDFRNFEELVEYIRFLDQHDEAYLSYFKEPLFLNDQPNVHDYQDGLVELFRKALASGPVRKNAEQNNATGAQPHQQQIDMPEYDDGKPWRNSPGEPGLPQDALGTKPLRIAACLSSYKRVEDFLRQILCMAAQSYPHLHVFAALKGVAHSVAEELVLPYVQPLIDQGKVTLRLFPNKDQFSNFLDTVQGLDVSEYDLFAKVDDDDFYDRDYFLHVRDFHATLPPGYSSCHTAPGNALTKREGFPALYRTPWLCTGSAQVMSRRVMEKLLFLKENPLPLKETLEQCRLQTGMKSVGFAEDQLFKSLMLEYGCGNIAPFLERHGIQRHLVIQHSNSSVMRGGTIAPDFYRANNDISSQDDDRYEHVIDLIHSKWKGSARLFQGRAKRLHHPGDEASVVAFSARAVTLKWDSWGTETFICETPGTYRLQIEANIPSTAHTTGATPEKSIVTLQNTCWTDEFRIEGNRGHRLSNGNQAAIVEQSPEKLVLDWDQWGREEFILCGDGRYSLAPCPMPETSSQ